MNRHCHSRSRLPREALGALCAVTIATVVCQATHIPSALDIGGYRNPMKNEGYLMYATNPALGVGRFGEEWTGWVDIRHPSLAGATDTDFGYDRSDRRFDVRSNILTDAAGITAAPDRVTDFNYANKAYMLQSGVSVIETSTRAITSGAGGAPAFTFPLSHGLGVAQAGQPAEEQAIMGLNGAAPTIETYYAGHAAGGTSLFSGAFAETYWPSNAGGVNNEALFMADAPAPRVDTFAHELYHFVGDGVAIHMPDLATPDPGHSTDNRNLIAGGGIRLIPTNISQVGPYMSGTVGGRDQLTSPQVNQMFNDVDVAPYLQTSDNHAAGHRVDWDFVADHNQWSNDHDNNPATAALSFGVEGITGADNHVGIESLYWTIGATAASPQAGKNKTGLGNFAATFDFAGPSFRTADVFSLGLNYSDSDVNASGTLSLRENALDYNLFFELLDGSIVAGIPQTVFIGGWTGNSFADNYLARWFSPDQAKGVFIFALNTNGHDGVTQIDAVIVSAIPEPASLVLLVIGLLGLVAVRRKS